MQYVATQRRGRTYWKRQSRAFFVIRAARVLPGVAKFGEDEYQRLPQFVRPGAYVIDVEANSGVYTFRLSRLVSKSGLVLSVEPYSPLAGRLRLAGRVLRRRNIRVFENGAGR